MIDITTDRLISSNLFSSVGQAGLIPGLFDCFWGGRRLGTRVDWRAGTPPPGSPWKGPAPCKFTCSRSVSEFLIATGYGSETGQHA